MHRAVRWVMVLSAVTAMVAMGSGNASWAAIAPPDPELTVAAVQPAPNSVVGVAHPVVIHFVAPVTDRAAAERVITIRSDSDTTGSFDWISDRQVQWVPDGYWPPHTKVDVTVKAMSTGFETGDALLAVASISGHSFTVSRNGETLREMPASLGKPSRPTPIGSFTALSKERKIKFDSRTIGIPLDDPEGYLIDGEYGVRVTWSGVYVHSAPWSVDSQGYANVSHGCINLSPNNAAWYFDLVNLGDPIIVEA
ncbi:L,D-transpeptidase [Mycolicibacillus parakoreensis]|uniref:L,D-transpeptidase n=1 Tax=Mycolicibacillus parakoreensis TaxID=1069221 RepID=A0ABY3U611_9MYCO|nr:L,D-transpeptidase [Mycolicibacillus parakoreensis]MCV7314234.1 L,D-transpeptidase [Mycolicibacillus parakoreensis]ULN52947.1 L,D-transpeptidase [Mycolicibacillus parakoreensis]HLR99562.1 L,D-transpeptidase [Mycolicibacillus parakoreensis]